MKQLTKLPSDKQAEPIVDIVLPFLWLGAVHSAFILVGRYVPEERLQGFVFALALFVVTLATFKAYKASQK